MVKTIGDARRGRIVSGMFVNEINRAVLEDKVDVGVHSLKDLPTQLPDGLEIACVPERLAPNDALVSRSGLSIMELPMGSIIGTDSPRRTAEIKSMRPGLKFSGIRGNIDTRIRKLDDGMCDGLIVASAALERLGMMGRAAHVFGLEEMVPAPGQGALAVVGREGRTRKILEKINDERAWSEAICERTFLKELGAGCRDGAGAVARARGDHVDLIAVVHDGGRHLLKLSGQSPTKIGRRAGRMLCRVRSI